MLQWEESFREDEVGMAVSMVYREQAACCLHSHLGMPTSASVKLSAAESVSCAKELEQS